TIYRNAKRLLYLANQLLDFRKLEFQELKHCPTEGEYISFIREIALSFTDLADKKRIALKFSSFTESIQAFFDHDKLEKILFNLLSNAFKFMQSGGSVKLIISSIVIDTVPHIVIEIQDTGIGIPAEKKQAIFERFTQLDTHKQFVNQGSGIGLSLVKAYVELMEGKINLESEENVGSTFTVILPIKYSAEMPIQEPVPDVDFPIFDEELSQEYDSLSEMTDENDNSKLKKRPVLLLVDDNDDFRFYLKDNFKAHYKIIEADNGERAWEMVCEHLPDLIVSDIMMPLLDGNTLCHRVKNDSRCSHIPVILLTAQSADKQKQQGLAAGADDYITKPFNFELLEARIKNLIVQRKKLQSRFSGQIDIAPSEIEIMPLDQKMLHKAIEIVEKNMANTEFSVEELSRELGMSRVHFYKKVLALTGKSPIKFIRTIRMKRAANLLMKSQMNVAEIAYEVGFNNPKYFARYFREEFGVLPSQYNAQTNQKE
ncbi:MAG: hypothetical protein RIS47_1143, partial [Bacteroidota bacterium]